MEHLTDEVSVRDLIPCVNESIHRLRFKKLLFLHETWKKHMKLLVVYFTDGNI